MTRQRDAALSRQQQTPQTPAQPSQADLSAEDIATKIDVWNSVNQQMNDLSKILNSGYVMLETWLLDAQSNRSAEIAKANTLESAVANFKVKLERLRNGYTNFPDIAAALQQTVISGGRPAVPGTIFDSLIRSIGAFQGQLGSLPDPLPPDLENEMRPYVGALRRDLNAVSDWQSKTGETARVQGSKLSKLGSK